MTGVATESTQRVLLSMVDISGYTKFMLANRLALRHAQAIISLLMEAIIGEVVTPLEVAKLEGDAVFLYARTGFDATRDKRPQDTLRLKLPAFFNAFHDKKQELVQSNFCGCGSCMHMAALRLKIIVHAGEVVFADIHRFQELSGVDVILVHRLLKNSVRAPEYVLMTEAAARELEGCPPEWKREEGRECVEDFGQLPTVVYYPPAEDTVSEAGAYGGWWFRMKNFAAKDALFIKQLFGLLRAPEFRNLPS